MILHYAPHDNNRYYFNIITSGGSTIKSKEYERPIDAIKEFIVAMEKGMADKTIAWGQLVCHHYKDKNMHEMTEVCMSLGKNDF